MINRGNAVNLRVIDLSKTFDEVNRHAFFLKLMQIMPDIPNEVALCHLTQEAQEQHSNVQNSSISNSNSSLNELLLLEILEFWTFECCSRVKWPNAWSDMFRVTFDVRQGPVLSPFLFAIYLDVVI